MSSPDRYERARRMPHLAKRSCCYGHALPLPPLPSLFFIVLIRVQLTRSPAFPPSRSIRLFASGSRRWWFFAARAPAAATRAPPPSRAGIGTLLSASMLVCSRRCRGGHARRRWRDRIVSTRTASSLVFVFLRTFVVAVREDALQGGTIFTLGDHGVFLAAAATTITAATGTVAGAAAVVVCFIAVAVFIVVATCLGCLGCLGCGRFVVRSTVGAESLVAL